MAGVPVLFEWGYFPFSIPCFPQELTDALVDEAKLPGLLGNCHASGTLIIEEHGVAHIATGQPIVYTSADSVFQIAAHEEHFGLDRLYDVCQIARRLVDSYRIGRVIARPFTGDSPGTFSGRGIVVITPRRRPNRHCSNILQLPVGKWCLWVKLPTYLLTKGSPAK